MSYWYEMPRISTDFAYEGIEAALMENEHLRVVVLTGKGGDILEFRDKRTDVDVLWHARHNWQSPSSNYVASGPVDEWMSHYPGGWQINLPLAGWGGEVSDTAYGLHGESALLPWDATVVRNTDEEVVLGLQTELTSYPFYVERELALPADRPMLEIAESITNRGEVELEYIWQQHVALGRPLIGPNARLDVPAETGQVEPSYGTNDAFENARLRGGEQFGWPHAPARDGGTVDLREFPPYDATLHDQAYATDLSEGWYAVTNPELDLGFGLQFPVDPFECLWYWQAFGGFEDAPFFGRTYNVGLEPTTAYPAGSIPDAQRENGTMKTLSPGETVSADLSARTYGGVRAVTEMTPDGTVRGPDRS